MQETRNQKTKRYVQHKKHNDSSKSLLISNYFRCKLIKLSTQKTKLYKIDKKHTIQKKKKPYDPTLCKTHLRSKDTNRLEEKGISCK